MRRPPREAVGRRSPARAARRPPARYPRLLPLAYALLLFGVWGGVQVASGAEPNPPRDGGGFVAEVVGEEEFLPADELDTSVSGNSGAWYQASRGEEVPQGRRWGLAPVRWGGMLSAGYRYNWAETSADRSTQIYEARLRVNSYLMKPYIALVSGDFGLSLVHARIAGEASTASNNLRGTAINGTGALNVFPQSRFPLHATLALSDSRTDGSLTNTSIQRRRLSLRQDYRPPVGNWSTSGQYDRSELTGTFGRDIVDRLSGNYSTHFDRHSISANGSWASNRSSEGNSSDLVGVLRHGFRYDDSLSIESTATFTVEEFDFDRTGIRLQGDGFSAQLFSFASWNPPDSPWRGTANLRYFDNRRTFGQGRFESRMLGGSASLGYDVSRNLRVFGVVGANASSNADRRTVTTSQSLGASYSSDSHQLGAYAYSWFGSGTLGNSTSSEGGGRRSANASAGHSLQRSWRPGELMQLRASLNQSVSANRSSGGEASSGSRTLVHSAGLTLQASPSERVSGVIGATLSDSRTFGHRTSAFQMLNTQLSGNWRIDPVSQLNANLTWQLTRQTSKRADSQGFQIGTQSRSSSLSGTLGYSNVRFFGVRGLRYTADFRANTSESRSRRAGDPDASRERVTLDLDQRLRYRIGRLDSELQARIGEVEGRRQGLIYFKVNRSFGAF